MIVINTNTVEQDHHLTQLNGIKDDRQVIVTQIKSRSPSQFSSSYTY